MPVTDGKKWPTSHLTVTILQARRLRPKDRRGGTNSYVRAQLGAQTFATQPVPNTLCPVWNATVTFALPAPRDDATALTLTVMHRRSLAALPERFLGRAEVRLIDVCRSHRPGSTKWLTLESKPKKKVKDRGEMEVSFCLGNLHSASARVDTQLPSICATSHGGWGSTEMHPPSSVQPAEKREPIQPSCAAVPVLDRAPPSVAEHTHERAASSPECVSSSSGGDEFPAPTVQALSDHSGLNNTTAAKSETTSVKIVASGKAGDAAPTELKEDANRAAAKSSDSTTAAETALPPPHPPEESPSATTSRPGKLLLRLGCMVRRLQYRWGLGANRGEMQPLHIPDAPPQASARSAGISESAGGGPDAGYSHLLSERLRALCLWVDRCLGRV
ncbi:rab11 family-interacting protein 5-like isoform X2 [Sardina pilchardus]|uniref:rab11 family-interacting protein 5-like isoform X2 n=1 Tax=Sardina pilchardus TaxID=27697 RepID=UPI002E124A77